MIVLTFFRKILLINYNKSENLSILELDTLSYGSGNTLSWNICLQSGFKIERLQQHLAKFLQLSPLPLEEESKTEDPF